ncbi:MAG: hypothetical protein RLY95_1327, partial [Pseudomonadota bacterium]
NSQYGATNGRHALSFAYEDSGETAIEQKLNTSSGVVYKIGLDWKASHATKQTLGIIFEGASGGPYRITGKGEYPFNALSSFKHYEYLFTANSSNVILRLIDESKTSFQANQVIDNITVAICTNACVQQFKQAESVRQQAEAKILKREKLEAAERESRDRERIANACNTFYQGKSIGFKPAGFVYFGSVLDAVVLGKGNGNVSIKIVDRHFTDLYGKTLEMSCTSDQLQ